MLHHALLMIGIACAAPPAPADEHLPFVEVASALKTRADNGSLWARTDGDVHGRLAFLRVNVVCHENDPRAVRAALATSLRLNLVDHFPTRDLAGGIVPPLSLSLHDVGALEALEIVIGASTTNRTGTWHVRDGILEVGPANVLARRTPAITRVYNVTDLLLVPPDFQSIGIQAPSRLTTNRKQDTRKRPRDLAALLMESIVTTVSPEVWHATTPAELEDGFPSTVDPRDPTRGYNLDPNAFNRETQSLFPLKVIGKWASIVYKNKTIIVRAPAFVHLGIAGLPEPVPPPASIVGRTSR